MPEQEIKHCIIIGAGPAGMTAALTLNRFHRNVTVLDAGNSRAHWIQNTHNCPGFPDGLSGDELLERLRTQAVEYGTKVTSATASQLERINGGFCVTDTRGQQYHGRTVLLATDLKSATTISRFMDNCAWHSNMPGCCCSMEAVVASLKRAVSGEPLTLSTRFWAAARKQHWPSRWARVWTRKTSWWSAQIR